MYSLEKIEGSRSTLPDTLNSIVNLKPTVWDFFKSTFFSNYGSKQYGNKHQLTRNQEV